MKNENSGDFLLPFTFPPSLHIGPDVFPWEAGGERCRALDDCEGGRAGWEMSSLLAVALLQKHGA